MDFVLIKTVLDFIATVFILSYLFKTPAKTFDKYASLVEIVKFNTTENYKKIIFLALIYSAFNLLVSEIIYVKKTNDILSCITKVEKVGKHLQVMTNDGRYGIVIKQKIK
jgi:hypothetical protein